MVITLPAFEAIISDIKYGTGFNFDEMQILIITGVNISTTASLTRNALEIPVAKIIMKRSCFFDFARFIAELATMVKNPSNSRTTTNIIMPSNNIIVLKSMEKIASSKEIIPNKTIATAPEKAAEGRSIFKPGIRVKIIPM